MKQKQLLYIMIHAVLIPVIIGFSASLVVTAAVTPTAKPTPKVTASAGKATPSVSVTSSPSAAKTVSPALSPVKTSSPAKMSSPAPSPVKTVNPVQVREDGLTIVKFDIPKDSDQSIAYLTLTLKAGYAHDPKGKAGLTSLTNELIYYLLKNTVALNISYDITSDFSYFTFSVNSKDFNNFCKELDDIIRMDALLLYDKCNELIQYHKNEPHLPRRSGELQLYNLLFGSAHPYLVNFNPDYTNLNINEVNTWFRKLYRPNNLIISSSLKIPADFLLKPGGRDIKETISLEKIPPVNCSANPAIKFTVVRDNLSSIFIGLPMPRIDEDGFFAATLVREYLAKTLWTRLREELGLCYDVQVSYSYFTQYSAPVLMITFQTLPADSAQAVGQALQTLSGLAKEGIQNDELARIKVLIKNLNYRQEISLKQITQDYAFQALFNLAWFSNQNDYMKQLNQVTPVKTAKLIAERLKYLKVSITGPSDMDDAIADISQKVLSVTD